VRWALWLCCTVHVHIRVCVYAVYAHIAQRGLCVFGCLIQCLLYERFHSLYVYMYMCVCACVISTCVYVKNFAGLLRSYRPLFLWIKWLCGFWLTLWAAANPARGLNCHWLWCSQSSARCLLVVRPINLPWWSVTVYVVVLSELCSWVIMVIVRYYTIYC